MSTLIKSGTLWFSDYHSRWLSAMEALTCQGFPVHAKWSYGEPCCSFAMRNLGLSTAPLPGRSAIIGQAGNSTHTSISLHPYILPHGDQDWQIRTGFVCWWRVKTCSFHQHCLFNFEVFTRRSCDWCKAWRGEEWSDGFCFLKDIYTYICHI